MTAPTSVSQNNGKIQQYLTAFIVNLATISCGVMCGWPSPIIPQLISNHPPVSNHPFTSDQISWINSIGAIGGLLTVLFCGTLSERLGRKKFVIISGLPHIISWLLILFAQNYIHLYAARLLAGLATSMTMFIVPLYMSEIATVDIRGILGSLLPFSLNVGVLFAYVTGAYLSYRLFASLCLIFPAVFLVAIFFTPETPAYLVRRNLQVQARKSLMFFRGNNEALVEQELTELRSQMNLSCEKVSLRDFFGDRATRKGLIISMGMVSASMLSGIPAMTIYTKTIFEKAGTSVSSETASIIIALVQIVGSQMSIMLMERAGRRLLSLISCLGNAISSAAIGLFFYLQQNNHDVNKIWWLPLLGLSTYIITFCLGMGPVPFVIISEVFRLDYTSLATTLSFIVYFTVAFVLIQMFEFVKEIYGLDRCFFMLAFFCLASFVFCYCMLPETKGRKREDIVNELAGINKSSCEKIPSVDKSCETMLLDNKESV